MFVKNKFMAVVALKGTTLKDVAETLNINQSTTQIGRASCRERV